MIRLRPVLLGFAAAAALALTAKVTCAQEPPAPPATEQLSPTEKEFQAAEALYNDGKFAEALVAFLAFEKAHPFSNLVPQAIYYEGWCLANLKRYDEATKTFDRLIKGFTNSSLVPGALIKQAECYREIKDFPKALAAYAEFHKHCPSPTHPMAAQAWLSEAWTLYKQYASAREKNEPPDPKILAEAIRVARGVRTEYASDVGVRVDALFMLGQIYTEEHNFEQARLVYEELKSMRDNPRATTALFKAGEAMYEAKRYEDAINYYQRVQSKEVVLKNLQLQVDQISSLIPKELDNRSFLIAKRQALYDLQKQINEQDDMRAVALFRIANCYQGLNKPEEASIIYRHFLRLYPDDKLAQQAGLGLIQTLGDRGQPQEAQKEAEEFGKKHKTSGDLGDLARYLQAKSLFDTAKYDEAQPLFEQLSANSKDKNMKEAGDFFAASCQFLMGAAATDPQEKEKRFASARDLFAAFIKNNPESQSLPDALFRLGRAGFEISQCTTDPKIKQAGLETAVKAYEEIRSKKQKPELLADVTFQLGYIYTYLGEFDKTNFDKAIAAFQAFLKDSPTHINAPDAAYQVASLFLMLDRTDDAVAADKFLLEHYPDSKLACFAAFDIGRAYAIAKKPAEMVAGLRAYIEKCPAHDKVGTAWYTIGQDAESRNKPDEAIAEYDKLIDFAASASDPNEDLLVAARSSQLRIAALLEQQNKLTEAVNSCDKFLAKFSKNPTAAGAVVNQIKLLFLHAKKFAEAFDKLEQLATQYEQVSAVRRAALTGIIELALAQRDYQRAYAAAVRLTAGLDKDPLPGVSYLAIGNTMLKSEHFEQARDTFNKVLELYGDDPKLKPAALVGLGQAFVGLKKPDDAETNFKQMVELAPGHPLAIEARLGLAEIYEARGYQLEAEGKKPQATASLTNAVDLYTTVMTGKGEPAAKAALHLGNFFLKQKDYKTALPYFLRVQFLTGGPMAEEATFRSGECNEGLSKTFPEGPARQGAIEAARKTFERYVRAYPSGRFADEARQHLEALPKPEPSR